MSDYCDTLDGEKQVSTTINSETKISDNAPPSPYELDLLDNLEKAQTKTENESAGSKVTTETEEQTNTESLSNNTSTKEQNHDEFIWDNKIFGDILRRIRICLEKNEQTNIEKDVLIDKWEILNDIFHLIDENEKTLTDDDLSMINQGLDLLTCSTFYYVLGKPLSSNSYDARTIFYKYFQLIDLNVMKNFLRNPQLSDNLKRLYCFSFQLIVLDMTKTLNVAVLNVKNPERPTNYIELLSLVMNFVRTNLETIDLESETIFKEETNTRRGVLYALWAYSDQTRIVPDLIQAGCVEIMLDGLGIVCKKPNIDNELELQLIAVICNISRHDDGIKKLNALNGMLRIKEFHSQHNDIKLNVPCCIALALLSTPEEIKQSNKRMDEVLDTLLQIVYNASLSINHRHEGFHLSEPVIVFVKLFSDDRTLDYVMEHSTADRHTSTVDFFVNLFIDYYTASDNNDPLRQVTCTALVNILWSVSFQQKYKEKLKNTNSKLIELLNGLTKASDENIPSDQYVPQYIENIQKAAKGLLFNIDALIGSSSSTINDKAATLNNNQKPIIMISYSHQNTDFCKQLQNEIEKHGYDTWIDFKFLKTGDLWEQIASGMKGASAIICLMSEEYCKSKSCRWEATFALDKLLTTKPVIPLLLRQHELPDWLDIRIAMLKYILFKNVDVLDGDKLSELINDLQTSVPRSMKEGDASLPPSVLPTQHETTPPSSSKLNEVSSQNNDSDADTSKELPQTKSNINKSANDETVSGIISVPSTMTDKCSYLKKPIEQWNKDDVTQWFESNEILTELRDLCHFKDGSELITYAKIFLDTEKLQYFMYSDEFLRRNGITRGERPLLLHEFTKLANALRKLERLKAST